MCLSSPSCLDRSKNDGMTQVSLGGTRTTRLFHLRAPHTCLPFPDGVCVCALTVLSSEFDHDRPIEEDIVLVIVRWNNNGIVIIPCARACELVLVLFLFDFLRLTCTCGRISKQAWA